MAENERPFDDFLDLYDSLPKETFIARRTAFSPLYEFFHRISLVVGVKLCRLNADSLRISHLRTVWNQLRVPMSVVNQEFESWDELISRVQNVRNGIEHNLEYDPTPSNLDKIRREAPEFRDWILDAGLRVLKESKDYTLSQHYDSMIAGLLDRAQRLVEQYRVREGPLSEHVKEAQSLINSVTAGRKLKKAVHEVQAKVVSEVGLSDLNDLVAVSQIVSRLEGIEHYLIGESICPNCGGNIVQTQESMGGGSDEPPSAIYYRVGCEKCDYELVSETIGL